MPTRDLLSGCLPGHQILHEHLFYLGHLPRLPEVASSRHEQPVCHSWDHRQYYSKQDSHEGEHLQIHPLLLLLRDDCI